MPAIILVYAAAVYLLFLAVLGYAAGFFAGLGVPKGIDEGPRAAVPVAVAIDLLLLLLIAVQHDLIQSPGGTYAAYRIRVPTLIPRPRPLLRRHAYGS